MGIVYTGNLHSRYRFGRFSYELSSEFSPRVTFREAVFSVFIVGVLVFFGFLIANAIEKSVHAKLLKYRQAVQIENNPEEFAYALKTDVGNAFVEGDFKTVDPISMEHLDGEYLFIERDVQKYQRHTRTVHYTDSKGRSRTRTEHYWSWDTVSSHSQIANRIIFSGVEFNAETFNYCTIPRTRTVFKCGWLSNTRYVFYTIPKDFHGTVFGELYGNYIFGKPEVMYNRDMSKTYRYYTTSHAVGIFWTFWIILIIAAVAGFYYIENSWLEENPHAYAN